jgi:hypothetical protein
MADDQDKQIEQSGRLSVQSQRDAYFFGSALGFSGGYEGFGNSLPSVYDPRRQYILNRIDSYPQNNMWQGALARIIHKVTGTSAEISGKRRVKWYQDLIFFNADGGAGFEQFVTKIIHDFCVYDDGAVVEIIGRGESDTKLEKEAIVGLAVLDPLRCFFTMNREYPVWYQDSVSGKLHKLHYSRVHRFVDQPLSDPELRGRGRSALSRAIGFVQQAIVNQTYIGEMLSNEPPPGILLLNGVQQQKWKDVWDKYIIAHQQQGLQSYQRVIEYVSPGGLQGEKAVIEFIPFSTAPTGYDPIALTELQAKGIALGLDTDPNDILPLSSSQFGNGQQSKVLDQKNRDGGFTHLLKMLERFFNTRVLPDPLRYQWKYRDSEQSLQSAEIAEKHIAVINGFADALTKVGNVDSAKLSDIMVRYIADNVDSFSQILTDPNGEMISLYDDDPGEDVPDAQRVATDIDAEVQPAAPDVQTVQDDETVPASKEYEDTRYDFTRDFAAIIVDANNGDIASRRRAGTLLRSVLTKYGRRATIDGLADGGVEADTLEGDDLDTFLGWNAEQSGYVSDLTARIWDKGLTEPQIYSSVESWATKSLKLAYMNGLMSADRNGLYEFYGDDGDESCPDCQRLKGKKFRLRDWIASDYLPSSSNCKLDCKGFRCQHDIRRATGRASSKSLIGLKILEWAA